MAGRLGRHARSKSDWGAGPARSAEVLAAAAADPDPARRAPGPKDTRSWCKGKQGRPHRAVIMIAENTSAWHRSECKWGSRWTGEDVTWQCCHREVCPACGKILREPWQLQAAECPLWPGSEEQRAAAEAEGREQAARLAAVPRRRRPVITGPQGYRRRRQEAR